MSVVSLRSGPGSVFITAWLYEIVSHIWPASTVLEGRCNTAILLYRKYFHTKPFLYVIDIASIQRNWNLAIKLTNFFSHKYFMWMGVLDLIDQQCLIDSLVNVDGTQLWFRWWLVAWRLQTNTWTTDSDLSSRKFFSFHLRRISQRMLDVSICICLIYLFDNYTFVITNAFLRGHGVNFTGHIKTFSTCRGNNKSFGFLFWIWCCFNKRISQ